MTEITITTRIEQASQALAEVRSLDEAVQIRDQAAALQEYVRRRGHASSAHADAWEIARRAERRIGEITMAMPHAPAGRPKGEKIGNSSLHISKSATLASLGLSKMDASRCERIAKLPEPEFAARVEMGRAKITKQPSAINAHTAASDHDGDAWGTPPEWIELARTVIGPIDLDPASNERAQMLVRAKRYYSKENSGLKQPWHADSLWLNPPYSPELVGEFAGRWCDVVEAGQVGAALMLVNNATETVWFQRSLRSATSVCFPSKRIAFIGADGKPVSGARQGQAIFYSGPKHPLFRRTFSAVGRVLIEAT